MRQSLITLNANHPIDGMKAPVNVLLVEDNPADVQLGKEILKETMCTVSLTVARDGLEAIFALKEICRLHVPTIMLLDINLPRKNGLEVLEDMNDMECPAYVKKVVFTSSKRDEDIEIAKELGADAYLNKPMTIKEFDMTVNSLRSLIERCDEWR